MPARDRKAFPIAKQAARTVVIHGLRRSGTTILWETLRSDPRLRCYDEPFHPRLTNGETDNHKGTWTELAADLAALPAPVAIPALAELDYGASPGEQAWLGALGAAADRVVIDIVRGWNRLPELHGGLGQVVSVQLVRDPISWVGAHLVPSGSSTTRRKLGDLWRKGTFFHRRGGYDGYQYQTIVDAALEQRHAVFDFVVPRPAELRRAPAYLQLLAFWWGANVTLAHGLAATGHPVVTVTLAEFAADPATQVKRIADAALWENLEIETGKVRPRQAARYCNDPRWSAAAAWLGLPSALLLPGGAAATDMAAAFAEAPRLPA